MTSAETMRAKFAALLANGSLPASGCGKEFLARIEPLLTGGILGEERSGAGRRVAVRDREALARSIAEQFPESISLISSNRVAGVARFRDSKAIGSAEKEIVHVRAWGMEALFLEGKPSGAVAATLEHGLFAFILENGSRYTMRGKCAVVENPTVFYEIEKLRIEVNAVIYGNGRISNRLLSWLAGMDSPDFELIHLPDYDPVGLNEHERFRKKLGTRTRLYLPGGLEEHFARYSGRGSLKPLRSQALLAGLRKSDSKEIQRVLELIEKHNGGLEQESLFVRAGD